MNQLRKAVRGLDRLVEWIGGYLMVIMVLIVFWQVFDRYALHHTPAWSEEIVLLLMMWFGFISIAVGFRRRLHISITFVVDRFPRRLQVVLEKLAYLLVIGFGVLLIDEGYKFTVLTWSSTLPVTKLPNGVTYMIIPFVGVLTSLYGLMWLLGWKEDVK